MVELREDHWSWASRAWSSAKSAVAQRGGRNRLVDAEPEAPAPIGGAVEAHRTAVAGTEDSVVFIELERRSV